MKKLIGIFVGASAMLLAQGPHPGFGGGPSGPDMGKLSAEMHFMNVLSAHQGKVVTGAPFSAKESTVETQTLASGTHINNTMTAQVSRDSQGRMRIERTFSAMGPWAAGTPKTVIEIHDPVAGVSYILDPATSTATKLTSPAGSGPHNPQFAHKTNPNAVTTDLGTQTIDGLVSTGTRTTVTIPIGEIGNDQPLAIVNEKWTSTDLQMVVQSMRTDPRMGTVNFALQNVSRSEPDASLFTVPSNYTVQDKPAGHRMHGGPAN